MGYGYILHCIILCAWCSSAVAQRIVSIGSGINSSPVTGVWDLVEHENVLILGGHFDSFNGHQRRNLQGWNGIEHFDLPGAFEDVSDRILSMAVHDGDLVAGGVEPEFGNICRWNGNEWLPFAEGFNSDVRQVKVIDGVLYVLSTDSVVHSWTGSAWEQVGAVFNGVVNALEGYQGSLYVGGDFTALSDGSTALRTARWNGISWVPVNTGLNGEVRAMKVMGNDLFIGGQFTADGTGSFSYPGWCMYDGSDMIPGHPAMNEDGVHGFAELPANDLILVFGNENTMVIGPEGPVIIPWKRARDAHSFNGIDLLVAGDNGGDHAFDIHGIARLLPAGRNTATNDLNAVSAIVGPVPSLFQTRVIEGAVIPKGSGHRPIKMLSPMVRGEINGVRHYSTYFEGIGPSIDDTAVFAGPGAIEMDQAFYEKYHRVWRLDRAQILAHQQQWSDPGHHIPHDIAQWPAHGESSNGEPAILAPFQDLNNNNEYEPMSGEYPLIKGDRSTYHISHSHDEAWYNGLHLPIDIHVETYTFGDPEPFLENTIFATYRLINRSQEAYHNVRFALFSDMAIGNPADDLVGCDTIRDLFYNYNAHDIDTGTMIIPGHDERPPAIGVKLLNVPLRSHRRFRREGSVNTITAQYIGYLDDHPGAFLSEAILDAFVGGAHHFGDAQHVRYLQIPQSDLRCNAHPIIDRHLRSADHLRMDQP